MYSTSCGGGVDGLLVWQKEQIHVSWNSRHRLKKINKFMNYVMGELTFTSFDSTMDCNAFLLLLFSSHLR